LEGRFLKEAMLPRLDGWLPSIKNVVIPLFPDEPSSKHKDLHEERATTMLPGIMHHRVEVKIEFPVNTNQPPAFSTEGAGEQMECCFLSVCIT
jgi:hypothetical protein